MQLFQAQGPKGSDRYLYLNGVRLTKVDEEQEYATESLASSIEENESGRHLARVAHLYFARHTTLPQADYEFHIITLVKKLLGPYPMSTSDWGWLGTIRALPNDCKTVRQELQRDLEATFSVDKFDSDQQKTFRVFQLLDPQEPGNLFSVVYGRESGPYQYLYPMSELPASTDDALKQWRQGKEALVPVMYVQMCGSPPRFADDSLVIALSDWFSLRLVNWFVGSPSRPGKEDGVPARPVGTVSFWSTSVESLCKALPVNEILLSYLETFLPHSNAERPATLSDKVPSARARAVFRWAIADLWLNRVKGSSKPSRRLLQAIYILITHLCVEPALSQSEPLGSLPVDHATLRYPLLQFFYFWLGECAFDSEAPLDALIELWCVYLTPWSAHSRLASHRRSQIPPLGGLIPVPSKSIAVAAGNPDDFNHVWFVVHNYVAYVMLLKRTLERLDQESNASLRALEAVARSFRDEGPFAPTVIFILLECERIVSADSTVVRHLPTLLQTLHGKDRLCQFFDDADVKRMVSASISQQLEDSKSLVGDNKALSVFDKESCAAFVRQLRLKKEIATKTSSLQASGSSSNSSMADVIKDCNRMSDLLSLEGVRQMGGYATRSSAVDFERVYEGVPSWISKLKSLKFRGVLTDASRAHPTEHVKPSRRYSGDYAMRPVQTYEIPFLVRLAAVILHWSEATIASRVDLRVFADARNLFWVLLVADMVALIQVNGPAVLWITSFAVFVVGAGHFRSAAARIWNVLFLCAWAYFSLF